MARKYQELNESSDIIILIGQKNYDNFNVALFNKSYKDARAFKVIYHEEEILFIKKVKYFNKINYQELKRMADKAFSKHDTDSAIKLYEILLLLSKPEKHVYARLGLLYLAQNNIYKALIFLKIATGLSNNTSHKKYDFTDLIDKITGKKKLEEKTEKPFIPMSIDDFNNDLNEYYGLENVRDVAILLEYQGMNIYMACAALNINDEDKNIITLILARDCYARGDMDLGDEFILIVEKSKNKSKQVKKLFEELRRDRLFYKNRVDENYRPLLRARLFY